MTDLTWIEWNGEGPCPIPDAKAGEYALRYRDGREITSAIDARYHDWEFVGPGETLGEHDILAYLPEPLPKPPSPVEEVVRELELWATRANATAHKFQSSVGARDSYREAAALVRQRLGGQT